MENIFHNEDPYLNDISDESEWEDVVEDFTDSENDEDNPVEDDKGVPNNDFFSKLTESEKKFVS